MENNFDFWPRNHNFIRLQLKRWSFVSLSTLVKDIKTVKTHIEVLFNKRKLLPLVGGALFFVLASILILGAAMKMQNHVIMQLFLITVGLIGILFFGLIVLVMLPKLFTRKAGLIVADEGLWDNSSGVSAGFVPWSDIKKLNYTFSGTNTFMVLMLKKPDKFIEKQKNPIKKLAMRINCKISGSPIHILVSILDADLHTLNNLIAAKRCPTSSDPSQKYSS